MIKIELNKDMCDEIDKFVATMVKEVDFRPNFFDNSEERSPGEIQENAIEGKYAELGFYQYIQGTKYESNKINLDIYQRGRWDAGDFEITYRGTTYQVEIKSSSMKSRCLLLPCESMRLTSDNKVYFYDKNNCPDWVIGVRVDTKHRVVELAGKVTNKDLCHAIKNPETYCWRAGQKIPGTSISLKVDNYVWVFPNFKERVNKNSDRIVIQTQEFIDKRRN